MISDALELMDLKKEELEKVNTFIKYFEGYHDLMAFYGLDRETHEKNIKNSLNFPHHERDKNISDFKGKYGHSYIIKEEHISCFKQYCTFLNEIPKEQYEKEAECLLKIFSQYSSYYREFDSTYANLYDEDDDKKKNTKNMSDKKKAHITLAKKFRNSLHGNQLSINDYTTNTINYEFYTESYDYRKEKNELSSCDDFFILIASLTRYIDDLETGTHTIRSKRDYENFFPKPSTVQLIEHIKNIVNRYDIKKTTTSIKNFQKELNHNTYNTY